jgi:WD40 repeat protein
VQEHAASPRRHGLRVVPGLLVLGLAIAAAGAARAPAEEPAVETLPEGAVARCGTGRLLALAPPLVLHVASDSRTILAGGFERGVVSVIDARRRVVGVAFPPPFVDERHGASAIAFSPDGSLVATVDAREPKLHVWEWATGRLCYSLDTVRTQNFQFGWLSFSPDGGTLLYAPLYATTLRRWRAATGEELGGVTLTGHSERFRQAAFATDGSGLATLESNTFRIREGEGLAVVTSFQAPRYFLADSLALGAGARLLASGGGDGIVRLWDTEQGRCVRTLEGAGGTIAALAFSPDARTLVSGTKEGVVTVWDVASGSAVRTYRHHVEVRAVAFSADGRTFATGSLDGEVRLILASSGEPAFPGSGHRDEVRDIAFSRDGKMLASTSDDGTVRVWDPGSGRELHREEEGHGPVVAAAFSGSTGALVAVSLDRTISTFDPSTFERLHATPGLPACRTTPAALSHDGSFLFTGGFDGKVRIFGLDGALRRALEGHESHVNVVALSPDGSEAVSGGEDHTVRVWSLTRGAEKEIACVKEHERPVVAVALSPDGKWVASADEAGRLVLSTVEGTHTLWRVDDLPAQALAFSPDGRTLAIGDGIFVLLYNLTAKEKPRVLRGHVGTINAFTFSPDGGLLASGSEDGTIVVWKAK